MNTPEKVQFIALACIFMFLGYMTVYTVNQTLEQRSVPPQVDLPKPKLDAPNEETRTPKQAAKQMFSMGQLKVSEGDCMAAKAEFDKAVSLDATLKEQVPGALDTCRQK